MFNAFDIVLAVVCFVSGVIGLSRGILREAVGLLAWVFAGTVTYACADALHGLLRTVSLDHVPLAETLMMILMFCSLFVAIVSFGSFFISSKPGATVRLLGFVYGIGRALTMIGLVYGFFVLPVEAEKRPALVRASASAAAVEQSVVFACKHMPERVKQAFNKATAALLEPEDER